MNTVFFIGSLIAASMAALLLYLFTIMRLSLIIQGLTKKEDPTSHIYWVYKNMFLIRITDWQPFISAILLWNYHALVRDVVDRLDLSGGEKKVLQHACAFGNASENIARHCAQHKTQLVIADIIENQLTHAQKKLARSGLSGTTSFERCDATSLPYPDESFDHVVSFFLFHELPLEKKREALRECMRVVKPGGKIICAEFHRPSSRILRATGWLFFTVFERYAREMWDTFDIKKEIDVRSAYPNEWAHAKKPVFFGNYATFEARKAPATTSTSTAS